MMEADAGEPTAGGMPEERPLKHRVETDTNGRMLVCCASRLS
jgi:hypothetical protein